MTQISITGASGFLGTYLVPRLAEVPGRRLLCLTRHLPLVSQRSSVRWVQGDLGSIADCRQFVESAQVIIHLAHSTTPLTSDMNLPADIQLNLVPTLNLLQTIREAGTVPQLIFASSGGAIYGPVRRRTPVKESHACQPSSSYGIVKLAIEQYLRVAASNGWLRATVLRIGNPYGVLLPTERMQGFIGVALNRIIHGQEVRVFGNPDNVRDYIHLQDVAHMVELILDHRVQFEVYNVGSGTGHSVREILSLLGRLSGIRVRCEYVPVPEAQHALPAWIVLDVTKARAHLGWSPSIDFQQGLRTLCQRAMAPAQP